MTELCDIFSAHRDKMADFGAKRNDLGQLEPLQSWKDLRDKEGAILGNAINARAIRVNWLLRNALSKRTKVGFI
jgi:hypothetical protein